MSCIGIMTETKNERYVNRIATQNLKSSTIIDINEKSIENVKNIKFDTILITGYNKKVLEKLELLKQILTNTKYLIINTDIETNLGVLDNLNLRVITYGFNSKSTITISSVKEESLLICIQRTIFTVNNKELEPQEILIPINTNSVNVSLAMGMAILLMVYEISDLNKIK